MYYRAKLRKWMFDCNFRFVSMCQCVDLLISRGKDDKAEELLLEIIAHEKSSSFEFVKLAELIAKDPFRTLDAMVNAKSNSCIGIY